MKVMQRIIHRVRHGKWAELQELFEKRDTLESRWELSPLRRYRCISGAQDTDTLVAEREWESLAAYEAFIEKAVADSE